MLGAGGARRLWEDARRGRRCCSAIATAEASFSAAYGYDVRVEFFGSAGMVTAGTPAHLATTHWTTTGLARPTSRRDTELEAFCRVVRTGEPSPVTGADARAALEVALAAIASVKQGAPVRLDSSEVAHA